jgi:hypothetical protein
MLTLGQKVDGSAQLCLGLTGAYTRPLLTSASVVHVTATLQPPYTYPTRLAYVEPRSGGV